MEKGIMGKETMEIMNLLMGIIEERDGGGRKSR